MEHTLYHIYQYHSGHNACHLHRLLLPARYCADVLRDEGIRITCNPDLPNEHDKWDALLWHGVPEPNMVIKCLRWQQMGKQLIWAIDDDYRELPTWNPVVFDDKQKAGLYWAASMANHICASTTTLAATINKPVWYAPNMLEVPDYTPYSRPKSLPPQIRIMWAGSNTHEGDLEILTEPITRLLDKYNEQIQFVFFSQCHPEVRRRHLNNGVIEIDPTPLSNYTHQLRLCYPDIWLCPLADHTFNHAKSNLKVIEGMGLKCAVVASNISTYNTTIEHGVNGLLASTENEWVDYLSMLIEDAQYRSMLAKEGHSLVNRNFNWMNTFCRTPWLDFYRGIANKPLSDEIPTDELPTSQSAA